MGKKRVRVVALLAGIVIALSGGMAEAAAAEQRTPPTRTPPVSATPSKVNGSGKLQYVSGVSKLTDSQRSAVVGFMDTYYDALARLDPVKFTSLFASDAKRQRQSEEYVLKAMCELRELQKSNLKINSYSYTLTIISVTARDGGDILVLAEEDCVMNFAAYSSTNAGCYNVGHRFVLTKSDGNWLLRDHYRVDTLTEYLRGTSNQNLGASTVKKRMETLLKNAKKEVSNRQKRGKEPRESAIEVDNAYKRKTAASYARKWVKGRNREGNWPDYGHWGGNCQNFVSQALYASGIPMDTQSPGLWKWYSGTPSTAYNNQGRSPSWSGVNDFLTYVKSNQGYGLVAHADAPYYSGEVGDIIHMGTGGTWSHTVIITKVLKDKSGNVIDYLVASNTSDLRDYPASAHYYTDQMLIKVYGWNNSTSSGGADTAADASADGENQPEDVEPEAIDE